MATPTQIEQGFRTAGFTKGRPTTANAPDPVFPNNYPLLIDLFDTDTIKEIQLEIGEPPDRLSNTTDIVGWKYFFAARVLETIIEAGLTMEGRPLDITSVDTGGYGTNYVNASEYIEIINNRIRELRAKGRKLGGEISAQADITVLREVQTGDTLVGNGTTRSKLDVKIPYTEADRTKLAGIEPGATAGGGGGDVVLNQASVYEQAEKIFKAGKNVTITPNDTDDTLTISSAEAESGLNVRQVGTTVTGDSTTPFRFRDLLTEAQTTALPELFAVQVINTRTVTRAYGFFSILKSELTTSKQIHLDFEGSSEERIALIISGGTLQYAPNSLEDHQIKVYRYRGLISTSGDGFNFQDLRDSITAGDGARVVVDNEKQLISIGALEQNGRWISLGRVQFSFPSEDLNTVKSFDTNIPFNATDQDKNLLKIFLTNNSTLDSQGAAENEFIVGLQQISDVPQATRRIVSARAQRQEIRLWRTAYRPAGTTDQFVRINIRRTSANAGNQFYWAYLTFAPEESVQVGTETTGTVELGGLTVVRTDSTLEGTGRPEAVLKVANPYTADEKAKLARYPDTPGTSTDGAAALHIAQELQVKTDDLTAGAPSSGWSTSANPAAGSIALRTGDPFTLTQARAAGYAVSPTAPGGKFLVVRLPLASNAGQARYQLESGDTPPLIYTNFISSLHVLGTDSTYRYYFSRISLGDHVAKITLQLTGNAAHIGTSRYGGIVTGTLANGIVTTNAIADAAITFPKMGINSVAGGAIRNNAITAAKISDGTITLAKLAAEVRNMLGSGGSTSSGGGGWEAVGTSNITTAGQSVSTNSFTGKTLFMILARRQGTSEFGRGPFIIPVSAIPTASSGLIQSIFYAGANFYGVRLRRSVSGQNTTISIADIRGRAVRPVNLFFYAQ